MFRGPREGKPKIFADILHNYMSMDDAANAARLDMIAIDCDYFLRAPQMTPPVDGYAVIAEIRRINPYIKILCFIPGMANSPTMEEGWGAGMPVGGWMRMAAHVLDANDWVLRDAAGVLHSTGWYAPHLYDCYINMTTNCPVAVSDIYRTNTGSPTYGDANSPSTSGLKLWEWYADAIAYYVQTKYPYFDGVFLDRCEYNIIASTDDTNCDNNPTLENFADNKLNYRNTVGLFAERLRGLVGEEFIVIGNGNSLTTVYPYFNGSFIENPDNYNSTYYDYGTDSLDTYTSWRLHILGEAKSHISPFTVGTTRTTDNKLYLTVENEFKDPHVTSLSITWPFPAHPTTVTYDASYHGPAGIGTNDWFLSETDYFDYLMGDTPILIGKNTYNVGAPSYSFMGFVWEDTDYFYRRIRYWLGTCLLGDGYFNIRSTFWYISEYYDINIGTPMNSYYRYDGPIAGDWDGARAADIYRRDYSNGFVIVNPNNVSLPATFEHPLILPFDAYIYASPSQSKKQIKFGFNNRYHKCAEASFESGLSTSHQSYEYMINNEHNKINVLDNHTSRDTIKTRFDLDYPSMSNDEYNTLQSLFAQHIREGSWYSFIPNHRFILDANNYMYSVNWGIIDRETNGLPNISDSTLSLGSITSLASVNSSILNADTYTMADMHAYMVCKFSLHHINHDEIMKMDQSYVDVPATYTNSDECPFSGGTDTDIIERIGVDVVGYGYGMVGVDVTYGLDVYIYDHLMGRWTYVDSTDAHANNYLSYDHISKIFTDGTLLSNMIDNSEVTLLLISKYPSGSGGTIATASGVTLNYCRVVVNGYRVMVDHQGSSCGVYDDRSYAIQNGDPFISTASTWDDHIAGYRARTNTDAIIKGPLSHVVTLKLKEI